MGRNLAKERSESALAVAVLEDSMSASTLIEPRSAAEDPAKRNISGNSAPDVVVYVEAERDISAMIGHAKAIAVAFGANILLVSVIEPPEAGILAVDPVDWDIRRLEVSRHLADLAKEFRSEALDIRAKVLEGHPAEQICNCVSKSSGDIIVVLREPGAGRWPADAIACGAMAADAAAILAIPTDSVGRSTEAYHRIFVPLDGSANAESAIPKAARLARAHDAELLLCHVTPEPILTEIGPTDSETIRLKQKIVRHNERVGKSYLKRVKDGLKDCGVPVFTKLFADGDARRSLVKAIACEAADIVVMASHGRSGHADVSAGDVAGFILDRSSVPVLVTRQPRGHKDGHAFHNVRPEGVRHPIDSER